MLQKNWFFDDFGRYTEAELKLFNKDEVLDRWLLLKKENIVDRKIIDVVSSQTKTNTIIKYYQENRIRQTLSSWEAEERWALLNKVVIDFKYMDEIKPTLKQDILSYIQTKYPNYIEDHLIKLNF